MAIAVCTVPPILDNTDLWLHLAVGKYIWQRGTLPWFEPFSYTASDHPYIDPSWLSSIGLYGLYASLGAPGLLLFRVLFVGARFAFIMATARLMRARLSIIMVTLPVLLYVITCRVVARPHLISAWFLVFEAWLCWGCRAGWFRWRWIWVLPLVHLVWVNVHGGHVEGLMLIMLFAVGEACHWGRARYGGVGRELALSRPKVLQLAALVPASLIASCVTPYGPHLLKARQNILYRGAE